MAASFYARYFPPKEQSVWPASPDTVYKQKRKREVDDVFVKNKPAKRQKEKKANTTALDYSGSRGAGSGDREAAGHEMGISQKKGRKEKGRPSQKRGRDSNKYRRADDESSSEVSEDASRSIAEVEVPGDIAREVEMKDAASHLDSEEEGEFHTRSKRARKIGDSEARQVDSVPGKHTGVFSKFKQSTTRSETQPEETALGSTTAGASVEGAPVSHGLEPLPQPAITSEPAEKPSYSTLPAWLSKPFTVSSKLRTNFNDLGIDSNLLSKLRDQGYTEAFAIQSALIPLLLKGTGRHQGDICISAATGSGKTLAYALPLIANLEPLTVTKLRGLIVVPTRELVRQAREACELCISGTGLRIGTAVGNVSLKEEEEALMRTEQVYDSFLQSKRSRTTQSWDQFRLQEYISEINRVNEVLPGHVERTLSNVDILICTPGRLVDHIRSTKGFSLEHLDWLVVDEADRLLNESFQDWVKVVVPALGQQRAPDLERADRLLVDMRMCIKQREPQKVILSATMTQDITQLNSLRLRNPKLVTVREQESQKSSDGKQPDDSHEVDQSLFVPPTLNEFIIPVGDGADKPLYLLNLLLSHIDIENKGPYGPKRSRPSASKRLHSSVSVSSDSPSSESSDSSDSDSDLSDASSSPSSSLSSSLEPSRSPHNTVLIFTKSSESASRLSRLLSLLHPSLADRIGTLTKPSKSSTSRKTLNAFRRGRVSVVVATDRASRGLDLPSLGHVVNYDVPSSLTTYVHRIGRTARAGNAGSAWTLVAHREGRWFSNEIAREGHDSITRPEKVRRVNVKIDEDGDLRKMYETALQEVGKEVNEGTSRKGYRATE